jgi:hypothetical protein
MDRGTVTGVVMPDVDAWLASFGSDSEQGKPPPQEHAG